MKKIKAYSKDRYEKTSLILRLLSAIVLFFMGGWEIVAVFIILQMFWIGAPFK